MTEPALDYKSLVQDDRIHASLYTDPRIFADEMERMTISLVLTIVLVMVFPGIVLWLPNTMK